MMKIILILFIIHSNLLSWEHFVPDSTDFNNGAIGFFYADKIHNSLWFSLSLSNSQGIFSIENNKIISHTQNRPKFDDKQIARISGDEYGNIIFITKKSLFIKSINNEWYSTANTESNMNIFQAFQGNIFYYKNRIYLNNGYSSRIYYYEYDTILKKYDLNNIRFLENLDLERYYMIASVIRSGKILSDGGFRFTQYDIEKNIWEVLKNKNGDTVLYDFSGGKFEIYNGNSYLLYRIDTILKLTVENELQKITVPIDSAAPDAPIYIWNFTYIPELKSILLAKSKKLYLINEEDNNVKEVKIPDGIFDQSSIGGISNIEFDGENVWIGTFYNYIYKIHKTELMIKTNVKTESLIPTLDIINLFPNPIQNENLIIEYFNSINDINEEFKLYNVNGEFIVSPKFSIISKYNMLRTVKNRTSKTIKRYIFYTNFKWENKYFTQVYKGLNNKKRENAILCKLLPPFYFRFSFYTIKPAS